MKPLVATAVTGLCLLGLCAPFAGAQEDSAKPEPMAGEVRPGVDASENPVAAAQALAAPDEVPEAEDGGDKAAELVAGLDQLDADMAAMAQLRADVADDTAFDSQALAYRLDERNLQAMAKADSLAGKIAELPDSEALRTDMVQRLTGQVSAIADVLSVRIEELEQEAVRLRGEREDLNGIARVTMESDLHWVVNLRLRYFGALVDHLETRERLGLAGDDLRARLQHFFQVQAEALAGRLQFLDRTQTELEGRTGDEPENTDLATALVRMHERHEEKLGQLRALVELMERLALDTTDYKSLLVQRGGAVSVDLIERGVIVELASDWFADVRDTLMKKSPDFILRALLFVLVLLAFRALSRLTRKAVRTACERANLDMSQLLRDTLESVSGGAVMIVGILMALSQLGISLGPMLAGLGIAGFIVGFALQDTLGNFAAGAMILIYRPYDVDDFIEVAGASGEVKKMNLVSTTITTFDNQTLVLPNSKIWGDVIKNVTAQKVRRVDLEFGIGYGDDLEHAERVLREVVEAHELCLGTPAPLIKLHSLGESSVNLILRPWVRTEDYWTVYWDLMREVKLRFDREGISIPFPQRDVHLIPESPAQS